MGKPHWWAVVPQKCFARAKTRLSPPLTADERTDLARRLFEHVVATLGASSGLAGVAVVTDGDDVERAALDWSAIVLRDEGNGSLGRVVDSALTLLKPFEATRALVLMADLPLVTSRNVETLLDAARGFGITAVPDRRHENTNALVLDLPPSIATSFGSRGSFALHQAAAERAGVSFLAHEDDRLAFDVDTPADHAVLVEMGDAFPRR